jgi:Lrp/AsnC family transcriptional regulator, leucine-responsive regulatory protein
LLDTLDRRLLESLLRESRAPLKQLAAAVGLSSPSTADRLRRLEETGVIRAFTLDIDPVMLGYSLEAIVRIRPLPGKLHIVEKLIGDIPQFSECDKVTGDDCFIARLHLRSIAELDPILERVTDKAETNTSIIKSKPFRRRMPPL